MKLRITVQVDGEYFQGGASVEVPEMLRSTFEPVDHVSDGLRFLGGNARNSDEMREVVALRENAAEELAEIIARHLVFEMSKHDTRNGYYDPHPNGDR